MKKVILLHDYSCFSKSSLTLIAPALESRGIETFAIPLSLLSTQTDGFDSILSYSLKDKTELVYEKVKSYSYSFSALYSGFISSEDEGRIILKIAEKEGCLFLLDPAFADNGEIYQTLDESVVSFFKSAVKKADIITPNVTEAEMLTDSGRKKEYSNSDIDQLVRKLNALGSYCGVITSIPLSVSCLANCAYKDGEIRIFSFEDQGISYPGCGDFFASSLLAFLLEGKPFFPSSHDAGIAVSRALSSSIASKRERRMGLSVSSALEALRSFL